MQAGCFGADLPGKWRVIHYLDTSLREGFRAIGQKDVFAIRDLQALRADGGRYNGAAISKGFKYLQTCAGARAKRNRDERGRA